MLIRIILFTAGGSAVGSIVGYFLKCAGGTCPLTCRPLGGALTGALIGFLMAVG